MKVEVKTYAHVSINQKEEKILTEAYDLLREIYENLENEEDEKENIFEKAYDATELIDQILTVVSVNE